MDNTVRVSDKCEFKLDSSGAAAYDCNVPTKYLKEIPLIYLRYGEDMDSGLFASYDKNDHTVMRIKPNIQCFNLVATISKGKKGQYGWFAAPYDQVLHSLVDKGEEVKLTLLRFTEPEYFDIACKRVEDAYKQPDLFIEPPKKAEQGAFELPPTGDSDESV